MPGCWVREDNAWEWMSPESSPPQVDRSDNEVVAVLLGPDGQVLSSLLEREPIGYRQRWI